MVLLLEYSKSEHKIPYLSEVNLVRLYHLTSRIVEAKALKELTLFLLIRDSKVELGRVLLSDICNLQTPQLSGYK